MSIFRTNGKSRSRSKTKKQIGPDIGAQGPGKSFDAASREKKGRGKQTKASVLVQSEGDMAP